MSLVQYSSSDDESDNEGLTCLNIQKPEEEQPTISASTSISSFLPPPRSSIVHKSKGITLGSSIKNTIDKTNLAESDNILLSPSKIKIYIPHSARNNALNSNQSVNEQDNKNPLNGISLFTQIKSKPKTIVDDTKVTIKKFERPTEENEESKIGTKSEQVPIPNHKKRKAEEESFPIIKDFDVSQFYRENIELKEQGLLKENKSLHKVTHHKNQLSALMKNAKQDEDLLKERHEFNKKSRIERKNQYGW